METNFKITIIGSGYVGLTCGVCFANLGYDVTCIDINCDTIKMLKNGVPHIYENGIETFLKDAISNNKITFSTNLKEHLYGNRIIFSCVGTPCSGDGSADIGQVLAVAKEVGSNIQNDGFKLFVTKSTVPVGTSRKISNIIQYELNNRGIIVDFEVVSNPEFLKEGCAINDFMNPDRVVIGVSSERAQEYLTSLYSPIIKKDRSNLIVTNIESSELIKYASNSMLATRISFMNEIASLCEKVNANIDDVKMGIGMDTRIGNKFLNAGCGYGGSCFPKDILSLIHTGNENGIEMNILKAVNDTNEKQRHLLYRKLSSIFHKNNDNICGKKIAIWGLSFKPETDDMRESPSIYLINDLLFNGAYIGVYDPMAMNKCKKIIGDSVYYYDDKYQCIKNADALVIVTEWDEFKNADLKKIYELLKNKIIIDGRNILNKDDVLKKGFTYSRIG